MKVLHVTPSMDPSSGGVSQAVRNMVKGFEEGRIVNDILSVDPPDADFLSKTPNRIIALGTKRNIWAYSPRLIPWLVANLIQYDIVIIHGLWQYPGYAMFKAMKKITAGTPSVLIMPHGMLDPYFQEAKGRKLKALRNFIYWKFLEEKIVNNADGLLFTCENERILAKRPFTPYLPKTEQVVGLGVEAPPAYELGMKYSFDNLLPQLKGGDSFILFLSRIHEKKGIILLLEAYLIIIQERLEKNNSDQVSNVPAKIPKLVIAGPGIETTYGKRIKKFLSNYPILADKVFFPGMLAGKAKWAAFYGCEAFVLPSHQENFGIAVVEALACSKPVLISNQINIHKEIKDSGAGLVASDTLSGILDLLETWFALPNEKKVKMGERAKALFENQFSITKAAISLKNVFLEISNHQSGR